MAKHTVMNKLTTTVPKNAYAPVEKTGVLHGQELYDCYVLSLLFSEWNLNNNLPSLPKPYNPIIVYYYLDQKNKTDSLSFWQNGT